MANKSKWASYLGKSLKSMASKFPSQFAGSHPGLAAIHMPLATSFRSPLGQLINEFEDEAIASLLKEYPGSKILILSVMPESCVDSPSPFRYIARVQRGVYGAAENSTEGNLVLSDFQSLPFATEQFDIVIVQHVLEFSENPQVALKEAGRVTAASGHLAVLAFNPLSVSGLISPFAAAFSRNSLWGRRALLGYRLRDWLAFIDFSCVGGQRLCHLLPVNSRRMQKFNRYLGRCMAKLNLPFSSVKCIVARKDLPGMLKTGKAWKVVPVSASFFSPSPTATAHVAGCKVLDFKR